ncbi:potassium/proton antiporter [Nitrincola tapanii]|uniref:Potassium/proton antiporter n=1 Tax=Nitrincola tapanii TaxID=1708751 RepID=A0A5A9W6Z1_9GAMM|nr:potassium/proton antiporter [Nitrincola tapanii]KAA0876560.1 potassium/proton antiporter [Nitrincola tapanii]
MILTLFFAAATLVISILLSPLSNRIGMPVLLLFLGIGMLVGQNSYIPLLPTDTETTFLIGHLALAIILLDGGMRTRAETFRVGLKPAITLATIGVVITAGITGLAAVWIFDLPLLYGLLIGTIISSTDAAAVFALLQNHGLRLNQRVSATLEIESGSNDPMAIFLTIVLLELITRDTPPQLWDALWLLIKQISLGALGGLLGGWLLAKLIQRVHLLAAFYPLLVTAAGLTVFAGTYLLDGSGFLAIYLMGVLVGNRCQKKLSDILQVHDGLAWLAQLCLFLILGLMLAPEEKMAYIGEGLMLALVLILVARPLSVFLTLWPFGFRWREQLFIAWVGLRGAVPIVLAIFPLMAGIDQAHLFPTVAFIVVVLSLIVQGGTLARMARWLKLELPAEAKPLQEIPLEWGGEKAHQLMIFELDGEHWTPPRTLEGIRLPPDIVISALLRDHQLLPYHAQTQLQPQDRLAVIGPIETQAPLAKLFSSAESIPALKETTFFGLFELNANITLADLQQGFGIPIEGEAQISLGDYLAQNLPNHPVVGDRVKVGPVTLVVKAIEGDTILRVGLKLAKADKN